MRRGLRAYVATWLRSAVACAVVLSWVPLASAQGDSELLAVLRSLPQRIPFPTDVAQAKSAIAVRSVKIDPLLFALSDDVAAKGPSSLAASAEVFQVGVRDDLVAVQLLAEDTYGRQELEWRVEDEGGIVTATFENVVYAEVPLDRIEAFDSAVDLYYMTAQPRFSHAPPDPDMTAPLGITEGVRAIGVEGLHGAGIDGQGVKVGILDFGFQGYGALVRRGELPPPAAQRAFNASGRVEARSVHGTACAEIVHAVAPGAELYLAAVEGYEGQIVAAAQWLAAQGVDVISFSGGGHGGPHDGTATLDRLVDGIAAQGILWVNAAGNEADQHWGGSATDGDGDQVVELDGEWVGVAFQPASDIVSLLVNWDDWGTDPQRPAATQDLDAFLFEVDSRGNLRLVAQSITPQRGRGAPLEGIRYRGRRGGVYLLALRATRLRGSMHLHVYSQAPGRMAPTAAAGSIGIPATARRATAVGAVHVGTGRLEPFSGQGPTDDGRTKPDVSAPDNTQSLAYDGPFPGTSAACPHVSGFAALLKQTRSSVAGEELSRMVLRHVRPLGGRTPNNRYGHGHIDGSDVNPSGSGSITTEIELPEYLGGRTSARTLDALWERGESRTARLGLRVRVNLRPGLEWGAAALPYRRSDEGRIRVRRALPLYAHPARRAR